MTPPPDALREALKAVVQDYRNEAHVIHAYNQRTGLHEGAEWRTCPSGQCQRMLAAIEKAEAALRAQGVVPEGDTTR